MNLIDCPECGRINNSEVASCHECDSPLKVDKNKSADRRRRSLFIGSQGVKLGVNEEELSHVDGGLRALQGRWFLWDIVKYYLLGHRASFAITNKRFIFCTEKTRDYNLSTIQIKKIASVSIDSDFLILRLLSGLVSIGIGLSLLDVGYGPTPTALLIVSTVFIIEGVSAIVTSKYTSVIVESCGGKIFRFALSGTSQANSAVRAVDKMNLEMSLE